MISGPTCLRKGWAALAGRGERGRWVLVAALLMSGTSAADAQSVTVDNEDPEFTVLAGEWETGAYGEPYGSYYNWALTSGAGGAWAEAEWRPDLPDEGVYQVTTWYVQGANRADNATFTVHHAGGSTPVIIDQQTGGETWVSLGSYTFEAGTGGYVTLHNEAHPSVVIADAIRFTLETSTVELTMALSPAGWGETWPAVGGPYTYAVNEVVAITALAYPGYEFHRWEVSAGSEVADPTSPVTTVTMDQDKTVTALFVEEGYVESEFRAFWADAFHSGYKSRAQIDTMIAYALAGNYNAIIPEVLAFQDTGGGGHGAYWDSDIVPKASDIIDDFDPLEYMCEQAHAVGIEVHAWLVAFRVSNEWPPPGNPIVAAHPEWLMVPRAAAGGGPAPIGDRYTFDPGSPGVQDYLMSIVKELCSRYDIDGIHWDYIRYTQTDAGYPADPDYEGSSLARFQAITGYSGIPATDYGPWNDFRRRTITEVVRRAMFEIPIIDNPRQPLRHTAALVTWYPASADFHQTNPYRVFCDWEFWQSKGYLDATIPMCYFDEDSYPVTYRQWVDNSVTWAQAYDRHTYIGPGIYLNSFTDSNTQLQYARDAGAGGMSTYSYRGTSDGTATWSDWYDYVSSHVFSQAAVPPPMPWRDPITAVDGTIYGRVADGATGQPLDDATVEAIGIETAQTDGNGYFILTKLSAGADGTPVAIRASQAGYPDSVRPAVLVERAGFTEANIGMGDWLPGDYDVSGTVDLDDYLRLADCLIGPQPGPPPAGCDLFDFDLDGDVDADDFRVFQITFGM